MRKLRVGIVAIFCAGGLLHAQQTPAADLFMPRVEVVQTIQDQAQRVPLIARKATAVRVFVQQQGRTDPLVSQVAVSLRGFRDGEELPRSPLRAINGTITAAAAIDRNNPNHSQNFILPESWTTEGTLELRADLRLPPGTVEGSFDNNTERREVSFMAPSVADPRIVWIPVCIEDRCAGASFPYDGMVRRLFPFADGTLRWEGLAVPPLRWNGSLQDLNAHLERWLTLLQQTSLRPGAIVAWLPSGTLAPEPTGGSRTAFWIVEQPTAIANETLLARQLATGFGGGDQSGCEGGIVDPGFEPVGSRIVRSGRREFTSLCEEAEAGTAPVPVGISADLAVQLAFAMADLAPGGTGAPAEVPPTDSALSFASPAGAGLTWDASETRTLRWSDASNRNQRYTVSYATGASPNDWIPLAVDLSPSELALDVSYLPAGPVRFRIVAESGAAVSENVEIAVVPRVEFLPQSGVLDFGPVTTGMLAERPLRIRNAGGGWLRISDAALSTDAFRLTTPLSLRIRAGAEQQVMVRYTPRFAGQESTRLTLQSSDSETPEIAAELKGIAYDRAVASITVEPASLDFGEVPAGETRTLPVTLRNEGTGPLTLSGLSVVNGRFLVTGASGTITIEPGGSTTFTVRFSPTAAGPQTGAVSLATNDPVRPSVRWEVRGTGTAVVNPAIEVIPISLDFGTVNVNQVRTLNVTARNTGGSPLVIESLAVSPEAFGVLTPVAPVTVAVGGQQVISLRFSPTVVGAQSGTLRITSNDAARPVVTVALNGSAITPPPAPAPRLSSIHPASIQAGTRRFDLTVNGANFSSVSAVHWNGSARPTVLVNSNLLRASIAPEDVASASTASITVVNQPPGGGTSSALPFTVNPEGASGSIVNMSTATCPTVISTLSVVDRIGNPVTTVGPANLACTEDGVTVPCTAIPAEPNGSGLSVLISMHTSAGGPDLRNMLAAFDFTQRGVRAMLGAFGPRDRIAMTQFDNGVRSLIGFLESDNSGALSDALDAVELPLGSGTALYDAIEDGIRRLQTEGTRRKALVLFVGNGNTYDTNGPRDINALIATVQNSGIPIYLFPIGPGLQDVALLSLLNQLALDSGGRMFSDSSLGIESVTQRLAGALGRQHLLQHTSVPSGGQPRQLRARVSIPGATFTVARSFPGCR